MQRLHDHFPALCRLGVGGDAVVSWYTSFTDPGARMFKVAQTSDGGMLIWVMALVGIAIIADVIINDWTPDFIRVGHKQFRLNWQKAFAYRHMLLIILAFCYGAQPLVASLGGYNVSSETFFYWNAIFVVMIAFFDAKQRIRSPAWQRAHS